MAAPTSPLPTTALLLVVTFLLLDAIVLASSSSLSYDASSAATLRCRQGWSTSAVPSVIDPSRIDDGYCDCPHDGLDEPNTSACAGSTYGTWAGSNPAGMMYDGGVVEESYFACPQQPSLSLPHSRVNDGVCDCCDGADESPPPSGGGESAVVVVSCPDTCGEALADERAARTRAAEAFAVGSGRRAESVSGYRAWREETNGELLRLKNVELAEAEDEWAAHEGASRDARIEFARGRGRAVAGGAEAACGPLLDVFDAAVDDGATAAHDAATDLASLIISLCALSAELSSDNFADGRCLALDAASLDAGVLWDDSAQSTTTTTLPAFEKFDPSLDEAALKYADEMLARLGGKKKTTASAAEARHLQRKKRKSKPEPEPEPEPEPDYESLDDDDYGRDLDEGVYSLDYSSDDDDEEMSMGGGGGDISSLDGEGEGEGKGENSGEGSSDGEEEGPDEILVRSLLERVPLDRNLFKARGEMLLRSSPGRPSDDDATTDGGEDQMDAPAATADGTVDPMAVQMTKSTISKYLSQISRGESSAKSAARFVASVIRHGDDPREELRILAALTMYHSDVALEDVAELVYLTSGALRSSTREEEGSSLSSCSAPSTSDVCPPRIVLVGGRTHPPLFLLEAAQKRCKQREEGADSGACAARGGDEIEFPAAIPDGYLGYHAPRPRGPDDGLASVFSAIDSLYEPPSYISELRKRESALRGKRSSLSKRVADLERDLGDGVSDGSSKYGVDGELYALRDTCHKVTKGKYEYEVCIFGSATQREGGGGGGGTNLGSWKAAYIDDGRRSLKWEGGAKCWNGPARSAEVSVTCGAETRLLTADEPETCRYVFTMESPIGCDEEFRMKNSID